MATNNLISVSFTQDETNNLNAALSTIEKVLAGKTINLTGEEKQLYGKMGDNTENWVSKVDNYMKQKPETVPFYIDKAEFDRDLRARREIMLLLGRVSSLYESLDDTAKLLSTDIYNAALAYYRNIKLIAQQNVPGTTVIYDDLSAQFPGRPGAVPEEAKTA